MPKRNKLPSLPDYVGVGENAENLLIQKSNPLLCLSETGMTLSELKILDVYLSRINSHEPDKRCVRFEKGEFEKLLGNTWMHKDDLIRRLKNLFQVIEIVDERYPKRINCVSLFEKASCEQDENGLWQIDLMCTPSAMEYIFNIENLGYLKYRLKSVVNITSRYSYILYLFLEKNGYQGTLEVSLDVLKKMLNCTGESYEKFKVFNDRILKNCQKEINEKTDISYTYSTIKKGRNVVAIRFDIKRKFRIETTVESTTTAIEPPKHETTATIVPQEQGEVLNPVSQQESKKIFGIPYKNLLHLCNYEFSENQMCEIFQLVNEIDMPSNPLGEIVTVLNFIVDMYKKMDEYAQINGIDSTNRRFAYLKTMLKNYKTECQ